jgi:uncharacterized protein YcgI (DUF1989 family)
LIGTDGATVARPYGHPESLEASLSEAIADFESEFFVEWQVADHDLLATAGEK